MRAPITFLRFLAVPALFVLLATPALAAHPRPKLANPFIAPLVPAYQQCSAPDRVHGPALEYGSCSSPSQTSQYLTVGTPDANGAPAKLTSSVKWKVSFGIPGPPHDTQSFFYVSFTDIRCTAAATTCGSANAAGGADYTGQLEGVFTLRITDHNNNVNPGGGADAATMTDHTLRLWMSCSQTADITVGSSCNATLNPSGFYPGWTPEGARTVYEMAPAQFYDGGADGLGSSPGDNTLFAVQGLFVP